MTSEPPISESKDAKLDQIMNELDNPNLNELPASAIEAAREHREQIIPRSIAAIEQATKRARMGEIVEENGHFFALYLLTEFEAK